MLQPLKPGEFSQGTLFTCAQSAHYPDADVLGMVITARCDTAQNKTTVYNYIPLVCVEDWIKTDGLEIVAKRAVANAFGAMKSALTEANLCHSILDFVDISAIQADLQSRASKQDKNIAKRFESASQSWRDANAILSSANRSLTDSLSFLEANDSLYRSAVKELMTNSLAEFHYLERADIGEKTRGYVALMREIRSLTATLGRQIAVGLAVDEFEAQREAFPPGLNHIKFTDKWDFAMPLSCVSSPYIELIMQRFVNLFSRIGVDDIHKDRITEVHSWVKVMLGTPQ